MHKVFPVKVIVLFFLFLVFTGFSVSAQINDTLKNEIVAADSPVQITKSIYGALLDSNYFLSLKGEPQALAVSVKKHKTADMVFYIIASLFLLLGLLRTLFSRYFTTMFRVFFNTSLRQNQLTDQLEQATVPSLLFNVFFTISMGLYLYFLYEHFNYNGQQTNWSYVSFCVVAVAVCYAVKYVTILFIGWLTGHQSEAKIYIFSVFLLNKIMGMALLPFTILIAFNSSKLAVYASVSSIILVSILLISRFLRSYGLLQNRLKLNAIHFFISIISLEILPIMLIYKSVMVFFGINS